MRLREARCQSQSLLSHAFDFRQFSIGQRLEKPAAEHPAFHKTRHGQSKLRIAVQRLLIEGGGTIEWLSFERALRLAFLIFAFPDGVVRFWTLDRKSTR